MELFEQASKNKIPKNSNGLYHVYVQYFGKPHDPIRPYEHGSTSGPEGK